jgi:hypothetical protein
MNLTKKLQMPSTLSISQLKSQLNEAKTANPKLKGSIEFDKQPNRLPFVKLSGSPEPHDGRFENFNNYPKILSKN